MKTNRTGSAVTILIVVLAIVVVLGGAYYFFSDVGRTKMNAAADQYMHWTPENIAKDPINYLNFCEEETKNAVLELKADEISVAQSIGKLDSMKEDATNKIAVADKALPELKALWERNQPEGSTWPVTWKGNTYDRDAFKRQMVSLFHEQQTQKTLLAKVEDGITKLNNQNGKIADARAKAQEQLSEISANRELLKVQNLTNDLTDRLVAMKSALQTTVATAKESNGTVSLDQLTADTGAAAPSDADFDKIIGKVK